jgi:hypothetical protein
MLRQLRNSCKKWGQTPFRQIRVVVLDPCVQDLGDGPEEWRKALVKMEAHWFAPLFDAVKRGALSSLTLHALGPERSCTVTATRLDALKFWRGRRR